MAFSLSKILGFLKGFLSSMPSPLNGFGLNDVQVNTKGDIFSALFSLDADTDSGVINKEGGFVTDIEGNRINLHILLQVANARNALSPIFSGLNNIGSSDDKQIKESQALLNLLLGSDRTDKDGKVDNTYEGAIARGKASNGDITKCGLLGIDLLEEPEWPDEGIDYAGQRWSWETIVEEMLKYNIEAQANDADYGALENVAYTNISNAVGEYLQMMDIVINKDEVQINTRSLVLPIACIIQGTLCDYFAKAYEKYGKLGVKQGEDQFKTKEEAEDEQKKAEQGPQYKSAYKKLDNGQLQWEEGGIDLNTPEGAARAAELESKGYIIQDTKHIDVTLQKVTGTSEIKMTAIKANYLPSEVLNDLEDVMDQDEFIAAITEEPQTFAIEVDDDGFDVETCECCQECDPCESLSEVFKAGIRAYRNLYVLHWMSMGNDMMKLHLLAEEMYEELIKEIDTLGELLVEKCGTVPALDFPCDYIPVQQYDFQGSLPVIQTLIQTYIDCIDYAYCNQDSDVQSTLDEWLRYWKKQLNYFVKGQEE